MINKNMEENYIKQYEADKEILNNQLKDYYKRNNEAIIKFNDAKQNYGTESKEFKQASVELRKWSFYIRQSHLALGYIRPNNRDDIEHRNYQYQEFTTRLQSVTCMALDIRYYGATIYNAEQIIKSKSIKPMPDSENEYTQFTDVSGQIPASTIQNLYKIIDYHSDIKAYERSLPCGCIFAIFPKGIQDYQSQDYINAVDFGQNPERLFGIITTPENNELVKKWMEEENLNPEQVYTFEEYISLVQERSTILGGEFPKMENITSKRDRNFGKDEIKKLSEGRNIETLVRTQQDLKQAIDKGKNNSREENDEYGETRDI